MVCFQSWNLLQLQYVKRSESITIRLNMSVLDPTDSSLNIQYCVVHVDYTCMYIKWTHGVIILKVY